MRRQDSVGVPHRDAVLEPDDRSGAEDAVNDLVIGDARLRIDVDVGLTGSGGCASMLDRTYP